MSENKTNNLNNTCARYEFISFENTQRITDPSEASNIFFCRKTSNFNGSCNVTLTFYGVTLTYTEMVSAVTCAVKMNRWQEQFLIGSRHMPPFSEGAGTSVHPRKCQRI